MPRAYGVTDVNLNDHVLSTIERLRPDMTNKRIFLSLNMSAELWLTRTDTGVIQDTLVALVADSCKSLSGGGQITIETANRILSRSDSLDGMPGLVPGEYVVLSLSTIGASLSTSVTMRLVENLHVVRQPDGSTATTPPYLRDISRKSVSYIIRHNGHSPGTTVILLFPRCSKPATINITLPRGESSAMRKLS
ncbi:MAG: hypothetical protein HKN43_09370 [Rhodothermales bacterium]|nr:hypothetical protein [Rhodothermales bacterium]